MIRKQSVTMRLISVVVGISLSITTAPANLYALAPKSAFSTDDESVGTHSSNDAHSTSIEVSAKTPLTAALAQEKIERAGVAMRGMIHGMRKYTDAPDYLADAGSMCEMVMLPKSAQHLKPKLNAITGAITNCYQSLKQGVFQTTKASIKGDLNASDAEACAKTLQTILVKVREENEKLNELYQDSALSNNKPIVERLDVIRSHLAIIMEILQSRIEIALGIKSKDPQSSTEVIKDISSNKTFETVKVENDSSSSLQFNGNRLSFIGAISNVIKNAQHFANKRSEKTKIPANVGLKVAQENSFVRMDISDNGDGVEPELLEIDPITGRPKLFNINVSRREKGTGLGTTEAWYVIRDAGGTIEVDALTEDEYQKFRLPSTFKDERQQWSPENKLLIKEHYPQIEADIENLIKLLNAAEAGNMALLDNMPISGLKIKPLEHILGNTIAIAQGCASNDDKAENQKTLSELQENLRRAKEMFMRVSLGKRIEPGSTFTIRVPLAVRQDVPQKVANVSAGGKTKSLPEITSRIQEMAMSISQREKRGELRDVNPGEIDLLKRHITGLLVAYLSGSDTQREEIKQLILKLHSESAIPEVLAHYEITALILLGENKLLKNEFSNLAMQNQLSLNRDLSFALAQAQFDNIPPYFIVNNLSKIIGKIHLGSSDTTMRMIFNGWESSREVLEYSLLTLGAYLGTHQNIPAELRNRAISVIKNHALSEKAEVRIGALLALTGLDPEFARAGLVNIVREMVLKTTKEGEPQTSAPSFSEFLGEFSQMVSSGAYQPILDAVQTSRHFPEILAALSSLIPEDELNAESLAKLDFLAKASLGEDFRNGISLARAIVTRRIREKAGSSITSPSHGSEENVDTQISAIHGQLQDGRIDNAQAIRRIMEEVLPLWAASDEYVVNRQTAIDILFRGPQDEFTQKAVEQLERHSKTADQAELKDELKLLNREYLLFKLFWISEKLYYKFKVTDAVSRAGMQEGRLDIVVDASNHMQGDVLLKRYDQALRALDDFHWRHLWAENVGLEFIISAFHIISLIIHTPKPGEDTNREIFTELSAIDSFLKAYPEALSLFGLILLRDKVKDKADYAFYDSGEWKIDIHKLNAGQPEPLEKAVEQMRGKYPLASANFLKEISQSPTFIDLIGNPLFDNLRYPGSKEIGAYIREKIAKAFMAPLPFKDEVFKEVNAMSDDEVMALADEAINTERFSNKKRVGKDRLSLQGIVAAPCEAASDNIGPTDLLQYFGICGAIPMNVKMAAKYPDRLAPARARFRDGYIVLRALYIFQSKIAPVVVHPFNPSSPLDIYFKQIALEKVDTQFEPSPSGYSETEVLASLPAYGGPRLPKNRYKMVYYDGKPLFLEMIGKVVIPLCWFDTPFRAQGITMREIDSNRQRDVGLITRYFGRGPEAWHKEILDGYDFSPRWLSEDGCRALGLKSLVVFQGISSPLEDMGEDARYEHQADNTIMEGIQLLQGKVNPGQRLLVYKPGTGAEAIRLALLGVHVIALCTSEEERSNVEVNAWLNGVPPENLEIVVSLQSGFQKFDAAYFNAPRPVYPEKSNYRGIQFMHFESDSRKFDQEGKTSHEFFRLAQEGMVEHGQVFCVGPNIPSYQELIYQAGFNVKERIVRQMSPLGDLRAFVLFKDDRHVLDHADLVTLLEKSVDTNETVFLQQCAKRKLRDMFSRLSETGIDKDIPASAHDYFGVLMATMSDDLISYILVDLLLRTQQYGKTFEQLTKNMDESILAFEAQLAGIAALRDPFTTQGLREIAEHAITLSGHRSGTFVKTRKLLAMLKANPPAQLIAASQKHSLDELLENMDPQTVFSLGRYFEGDEWTKRNFTLYENLQPDDFEERPILIAIFETLPPKVMQYFKGKLPFSNDKVAGTLTGFPVPPSPENKVPRLRALTRALHYLHELNFYSEIVRTRIPGALEQEQSIGKIFTEVLGEKFNVDQFYESHAMAEVLFMVQTLEDMEKSDNLPVPKEWNALPFSLGNYDGKELQWTSIIDRITTLSKGSEGALHARRYLRLAPLPYYYGRWEDSLKLLVTAYTNPEFISIALEQGWSLNRLHSSRDITLITSDYSAKVHAYLKTLERRRSGTTSQEKEWQTKTGRAESDRFVSDVIALWREWNYRDNMDEAIAQIKLGSDIFFKYKDFELDKGLEAALRIIPANQRSRVRQVLVFLAENIGQHGNARGVLVVRLDRTNSKVYIAAMDMGEGFPVDDKGVPRIKDDFGKFYKKPGSPGSGWGLEVVDVHVNDLAVFTRGHAWMRNNPLGVVKQNAIEGLNGTLFFAEINSTSIPETYSPARPIDHCEPEEVSSAV